MGLTKGPLAPSAGTQWMQSEEPDERAQLPGRFGRCVR